MKKYRNLVIASILTIVFAILIYLIKSGNIVNFDNSVYNLVTTNTNTFLDNMFQVFTFLGSTLFIVAMCIVILIFMKKKKVAGIIVGCVIISTIANNVIKVIIRRERPLVRSLVNESTFSFPSGHTMASVTLYGILIFFVLRSNMEKKMRLSISVLLGLIPILVAISRIYLGAHFASDVVAAGIMSSALLFIETYFISQNEFRKDFFCEGSRMKNE